MPVFAEEAHMRPGKIIKKFLLFKLLRRIPGFPLIPPRPSRCWSARS
jgi:hypothetical protein